MTTQQLKHLPIEHIDQPPDIICWQTRSQTSGTPHLRFNKRHFMVPRQR